MTNPELRHKVIQLYKTLLYMGRDYPKGYSYFRQRCHAAFMKNKDVQDEDKIKQLIKHGEFVVKELEALYFLKKYRTLKKRYYNEDDDNVILQKLESKMHHGETNTSNNSPSDSSNK